MSVYSYIFNLKDYISGGLSKLNGSMNSVSSTAKSTDSVLKKLGAGVAMYFGGQQILTAGQQALTLAGQIDDQLANVGKTTGMAGKELESLYTNLGAMDTRTSVQGLIDIATVGGKMGVAKKDIELFTGAVDKLAVSLGDEFAGGPAEIAEVVGKLKNNFAQFNGMSYEDAFLKIGSAMNALADAGIASAGFISEFATRVSAGNKVLSAQTVFAFGAALEETGLSAEIAGSGFKSFAAKAANELDTIGAHLGKSKAELMDMLNTDAGQLQFVQSMAKSFEGMGFAQIQQTLKKMKLADQETVAVFQNLSQAIGKKATDGKFANRLEELLAISTREIGGAGDSVLKEFERKNNTLAAKFEKTKKSFTLLSREIGLALAPIVGVLGDWAAGLATRIIPAVKSLADTFNDNIPVIKGVAVATGIAAVAAGVYAAVTFVQKKATDQAFISQMRLNVAVLANPYVAAAAGVAALVGYLVYAYNEFEGFRQVVDGTWAGLKAFGVGLVEWGITVWNSIKMIGTGIWEVYTGIYSGVFSIVGSIIGFVAQIFPPLQLVIDWFNNAWSQVTGDLVTDFGNVISAIGTGITALWGMFQKIGKGIYDALSPVFSFILDLGESIAKLLGMDTEKIKSGLSKIAMGGTSIVDTSSDLGKQTAYAYKQGAEQKPEKKGSKKESSGGVMDLFGMGGGAGGDTSGGGSKSVLTNDKTPTDITGSAAKGSGMSLTIQNLNVEIQIITNTVRESTSEIKAIVTQAIMSGINDTQAAG